MSKYNIGARSVSTLSQESGEYWVNRTLAKLLCWDQEALSGCGPDFPDSRETILAIIPGRRPTACTADILYQVMHRPESAEKCSSQGAVAQLALGSWKSVWYTLGFAKFTHQSAKLCQFPGELTMD